MSIIKVTDKHVSKIFSINISHDSSVAYLEDGKLVWMIEEERLSHRKHDALPYLAIARGNNIVDRNSIIAYTALELPGLEHINQQNIKNITSVAAKIVKKQSYICKSFEGQHHLSHASIGFYNSGFEEATVIVVDGAGAIRGGGHEVESIYKASYPDNFELVHQRYIPTFYRMDEFPYNPTSGIGMAYAAAAEYIGYDFTSSGKLMGLAPYGKENPKIKPFITDEGEVNDSLFYRIHNGVVMEYYDYIAPAGAKNRCKVDVDNDYNVFVSPSLTPPDEVIDPTIDFSLNCDISYRIQKDFETYMVNLIKKSVEITGCKNIVLSGGCALNCVANYEYLNHLPKGGNLYVEPICYDAGIPVGQAMLEWRSVTKSEEVYPLKTLYLGPEQHHIIPDSSYDVSFDDVVDLIIEGHLIGIFQGRSEQGPRALGNRSLLFDPRNPDAQVIVNKNKGREWWRPFAASVLLDHVHKWFDMRSLEESPYMMFAVNAYDRVWDKIPGVLHVDKTCRIQTVSRDQNPNYYDLIETFYKKTGVPMLLNTSFNLSGDTICESVDDVVDTMERSQIQYTYFPEFGKMLYISNNYNSEKCGKINYSIIDQPYEY